MSDLTKIFVSYSHKDEEHYNELMRHLKVVEKTMRLDVWSDQRIDIGEELDPNIQKNLVQADIVICLVSTDYLTSYYCIEKELDVAIQRKNIEFTDIFPIITKKSLWQRTYFGTIKCAPKDGKPATSYASLEEAYLEVVDQLMAQIERKQSEKKNSESLPAIKNSSFDYSPIFSNFVNELGLKIKHPNKDVLELADIFIYPDLEHITSRSSISYKEISSEKTLKLLDFQYILGTEKSGKSTLVKKYAQDLILDGYNVIVLDGEEIKHTQTEELIRTFKKKFSITKDITDNKAALIVDDFHKCKLNDRYIDKFFSNVTNDFSKVIFFVDKQYFVGDRVKHLNLKFETLEIKSFGYVKRNELYTKWYSIGLDEIAISDDKELINKIDTLTNHFDLLLRKNVMDSKPINILTIIQTLDNINLSRDFSLTSYGHCYNTLILGLLNKSGVKPQEFDSVLSFLSYLAFKLFSENKNKFDDVFLYATIIEYKEKYILIENIQEILTNSNILYINSDEDYLFSQQYIYYFCCSRYIANHQKSMNDVLIKLCDGIHTEHYANILIFLVHHSTSPDFLEYILNHGSKILKTTDPHYLTSEQNYFFNNTFREVIENEIKQIRLEEKNIFIERNKILEDRDKSSKDHPIEHALDEIDSTLKKSEIKENFEYSEMQEANSAFRCLEVIGQIAKNNYGSLEREKLNSLLNTSFTLGLKSLSYFLNIFIHSDSEVKDFMISIIKEKNITSDDNAIYLAEKMIFQICNSICQYMINFISKATASTHLETIFDNLLSNNSNPAYKLIYIQSQLRLGKIPKQEIKDLYIEEKDNNLIVCNILKRMIINFTYIHKVDLKDKNWISSNLNISHNEQFNKLPETSLIKKVL